MKSASAALIESAFLDTHKSLLQWLRHRLGCRHTAEDLVQETYLRALQQDSLGEVENLPAYLFRIAGNLVVDHVRRTATSAQDRHQPLDEELICPSPLPEKIAETSQELDFLSHLIAELPPQCRRIFLLRRVRQLSHAEIAEQLGISPRTVEKQIGNALRILRDRMNAQ